VLDVSLVLVSRSEVVYTQLFDVTVFPFNFLTDNEVQLFDKAYKVLPSIGGIVCKLFIR
jgi:hypothetical protein